MGKHYYLAGFVFGCGCALAVAAFLFLSLESVFRVLLEAPVAAVAGVASGLVTAHGFDRHRRGRGHSVASRIALVPMLLLVVAVVVASAVNVLANVDPAHPFAQELFDWGGKPAWALLIFGLPMTIPVGFLWRSVAG